MLVSQRLSFTLNRYNLLKERNGQNHLTTFSVWVSSVTDPYKTLFKNGCLFCVTIDQSALENLFKTYLSIPEKQDLLTISVCMYNKPVSYIANQFMIDTKRISLINHYSIRSMIKASINTGYCDFAQGLYIEKELDLYE